MNECVGFMECFKESHQRYWTEADYAGGLGGFLGFLLTPWGIWVIIIVGIFVCIALPSLKKTH